MAVDLHIHTTASDGTLSPTQAVEAALRAGLTGIAITDHDTVSGVAEAVEVAGGRLRVVPGVEINTDAQVDGRWREVHILGYLLDPASPALDRELQRLRVARYDRAQRIVERLAQLRLPISFAKVREFAGGSPLGRPHIAQAMVDAGLVGSVLEAFRLYLGLGRPAYVERYKLSPEEAVRLVHSSGGAAVLAHPGLVGDDSIIAPLAAAGLDGLEARYPEHGRREARRYAAMARRYGLVVTGGSDAHGPGFPGRASIGEVRVPDKVIDELAARRPAGEPVTV
ncbi:MAG: PHP domain-containing protein [Bacillota bacterium]